MDFENRVALVTGGTGALGSAVSLDLVTSGARVAVTYRSSEEWERLLHLAAARRQSLLGLKVDLTVGEELASAVRQVAAEWGRIDFLVAVAGGFAAGTSFGTDERAWDQMMNLNLRSLFLALRAVVPVMIGQNFGRIVTVSSGAILRGGGAGLAAYAVSKGGVRHLSEILAEELKAYDIRVRCVMTGTMDTEANRRAMPKADFSKWVTTKDVARAIHQLLG
jgi:NAD(P)-dependent dehydrogenase (short-subunit alcohol dehydrogenase family)